MAKKDSIDQDKKTDQASGWQYKADSSTSPSVFSDKTTSWTALEFIYHEKNQLWYVKLISIAVIVAIITYLLTGKDAVSGSIVLLVAVVFAVLAARKPRQMDYSIDNTGIHIGERLYPFSSFKSFSMVLENEVECIWLLPMKRFMPIIPIYFDKKDAKDISDILSNILPLENYEPDLINKILHKIHF